jgi:hypothetical protein
MIVKAFWFVLLALFVVGIAKPTFNFVGSFSNPCKQSFYNSDTLFEASRDCLLRK